MATDYTLSGITASIAPHTQTWTRLQIGRDHNQRAIYAGNEEITLDFPPASITFARQWMEAASSGSLNMTVLDRYGVGWRDLSGVQLEVVTPPSVQSRYAGPWSMIVRGASPN